MKGIVRYRVCGLLLFMVIALVPLKAYGAMEDYCVVPPTVVSTVRPNIMLALDYSGSMQWPAYLNCQSYYCSSLYETYDPNKIYYGYFKPDKYYKYSGNKFYVNSACTDTDRIGSPDCISGNLLNWVTMSRIDVLRMALIGGKANSNQCNVHTLLGEGSNWTVYESNLNCSFTVRRTGAGSLSHNITIATWPSSGGLKCSEDTARSDYFNNEAVDSKWTVTNIGSQSPPVSSTVSEAGEYLYVKTNGSRIWSNSDRFTYVYQTITENYFDVRLRVIRPPGSLTGQQWAKAGLMVRESTNSNSRHIMVNVTYYNGSRWRLQFALRPTNGGWTYNFASNVYLPNNEPVWVRLVRNGNTFTAYYSTMTNPSPGDWIQHGSYTFGSFPTTALVGMGTASYNASVHDTGVYDAFVFMPCVREGCRVGTLTNANVQVDVPERKRTDGVLLEIVDKDGDCTYDANAPRIGLLTFQGYCARIRTGLDEGSMSSLINHIQNISPDGATPTAYAMQEIWDYFVQKDNFRNTSCNSSNNPYIKGVGSSRDPWYEGGKPVPCRKSFVLLLSDGEWNAGGEPVDEVYKTHISDLRPDMTGTQILNYYTVFEAFGSVAYDGRAAMQNISMYGSFTDMDNNKWPFDRKGYPSPNSKSTPLLPQSPCDPNVLWKELCKEWDEDADGLPDTYFDASSGTELVHKIRSAFESIMRQVSAGTAVSLLASAEGAGANMLQAVFYPKRTLGVGDLSWIGAMQSLWYHLNIKAEKSTIREDTDGDKRLVITNDRLAVIYFDKTDQKTRAKVCTDSDGNDVCDGTWIKIDFEDLKNLWEAGLRLFVKDPSTRTIYTNINDDTTIDLFNTANASTLKPLLNAADVTEATRIIKYIRGEDVKVCSVTTTKECTTSSQCPAGEECILPYRSRTTTLKINNTDVTNTWKLGDIVHSTPRVLTPLPLNDYKERYCEPGGYCDTTYEQFVKDLTETNQPKTKKLYTNRGMVFVGANDGMLHAFYLGKLTIYNDRTQINLKAKLEDLSTKYDLGDEVWAFIPKNALPYLKYYMQKGYCHLYYVDASPFVFDASIGTTNCTEANYWDCKKTTDTWRTILIGSMNLGGACRDITSTCTDCVKTPVQNIGYSSYFALDITDPENPKFLWEFSNPALGFSSVGPVVFRVNARTNGQPDKTKNGRWFVLLVSGPTGPIDKTKRAFLGRSDQNLKFFILDLKTGKLLKTIDTGIQYAFGGSSKYATLDLDTDYQDDVLYISYTKRVGSGVNVSWTGGGIIRFVTRDIDPDNLPTTWKWSKLIEVDGPVTTSPVFFKDTKNNELWVYFGTGRYFYKEDDITGRRKLYGVKEPCYVLGSDNTWNIDTSCSTTVLESALSDATSTTPNPDDTNYKGWYIKLDCAYNDSSGACVNNAVTDHGAERVITDPAVFPKGPIYFTTFTPSADVCSYGGNTYVWAVHYRTGGQVPSKWLRGKILLQLSTGEIRDVDLSSAFVEREQRRTVGLSGTPPKGQGMSFIAEPDPLEEFIFIKEK